MNNISHRDETHLLDRNSLKIIHAVLAKTKHRPVNLLFLKDTSSQSALQRPFLLPSFQTIGYQQTIALKLWERRGVPLKSQSASTVGLKAIS